jgi:uncharacterized protein YukE
MGWIIGLLVVGFLIYVYIQTPDSTDKMSAAERKKTSTNSLETHWQGQGDFAFEIVGESFYQNELNRLAGAHSEAGAETDHIAELVPEDDNEHDSKAMAVKIQGRTVGYLSREDARSFRRRLGKKGLTGTVTTCEAKIVGGGTRKNGEKLHYGVKLNIKPFDR